MYIRRDDLASLETMLDRELANGNQWMAFEEGLLYEHLDKFRFFETSGEAIHYCLENEKGNLKFSWIAAEPHSDAVQSIIVIDGNRKGKNLYVIDDDTFRIHRDMKNNLDQNPLVNPDGNGFTEELISYIERHNKNSTSREFSLLAVNFGLIRSQLNRQGYDSDYFLTLEASMLRGLAKHEERYFSQYDTETVMYDHLFTRNREGNYSLDKITGTLYSHNDVNHATINGINTQYLENELLFLDSKIGGPKFLKEYGPTFQKLCDDPNGRLIAVQLYNNNVPQWWDKPDFISRIEDELKIYPKVTFPGETTRTQVYEGLKSYQEISNALREYEIPDTRDEKRKIALTEKLVNGQACTLVAPSGPHQGKEVFISWDWMAKVLSFIFKDHFQLDARQYFTKTNSVQFQNTLTELSQYPIRQLENDTTAQGLILDILEGHKKPIHLEKTIVPAEHIDKYIVIERPFLNVKQSVITPVEQCCHNDLTIVRFEMHNLVEYFNLDESKGNSTLMLVGQYKGKTLQYEPDGMPTVNSGFRIATIYNFSPEGCIFSPLRNLNLTNRIVEEVFVQKDIKSNRLMYSNKHGQSIDIDKEFWTSKQQSALDKKQSATEVDLIPKLRVNGDNYKGKTL